MKNKAKIIIPILLVITVIIVAVILLSRRNRKEPEVTPDNGSGNGSSANSSAGTAEFPLSKGSRGNRVNFVQRYINFVNGSNVLTVDGIWGNNTEQWARSTFLLDPNDTRPLEIDIDDYNAMVRIWNFCKENNLTYSQFLENYTYNYKTEKVERNASNISTIGNSSVPGTFHIGMI